MSLPSLVPDIRVNVADLPPLLPWSLRYNFLYPYCDLFSHIVPTQPGPPRWNAELEAYHRTFDPDIWLFLGHDQDDDSFALRKFRSRSVQLKRRKRTKEVDGGASLADLEAAIASIESRLLTRWNRLLGLHEVRQAFLRPLKMMYPGQSQQRIMKTVLSAMDFERPLADPSTLWPISMLVPHHLKGERPGRVCFGHDGVNWTKYALPDHPTLDSEAARRRLEPTAAEMLEDADELAEPGWAEATMDDATAPLLLSRSDGGRSSGFIPAFTGLLHRRHLQVA